MSGVRPNFLRGIIFSLLAKLDVSGLPRTQERIVLQYLVF